MKKEYCVYVHINKVNGKQYIGITSQKPQRRWRNGKGYLQNPHFKSAIEKYGWDGFEHYVLMAGLTKEQAVRWEQALIAQWDTTNPDKGYNVGLGGEGTNSVSNKTREKMRIRNFKWYANHPEAKERRWHGIEQYDRNGNWMRSFESILEATQVTGIGHSCIIRCCKGKGHTAGGYQWRYSIDKVAQLEKKSKWQKFRIAQYDMEGHPVRIYESVKDAETALGLKHPSKITYACNGYRKSAHGYMWKHIGGNIKQNIESLSNEHFRKVCQYTLDGMFVRRYDSIRSAAKATGIREHCIWRVCAEKRKTTGGYIWRYKDEIQDKAI